ncbi:MAG: hypothetical protein ACR2KP_06670 [Egibacteraceae bacterium]
MAETLASARGMPLHQGTVTFLFTDIQGSTKLLQRLGGDYGPLLATHPLRSRRPPTNLPRHLEPLVGRHEELDGLRSLLLDDTCSMASSVDPPLNTAGVRPRAARGPPRPRQDPRPSSGRRPHGRPG